MSTICTMPRLGRSLIRTLGAALLTVALAGPALADDDVDYTPPPDDAAAAAQAKADAARQSAERYQKEGAGWAYKSGAVDRANGEAAWQQAKADALRTEETGAAPVVEQTTATSPDLTAARERLETLKDTGGPEYKSGAVDRAENQVRQLETPVTVDSLEPGAMPVVPGKPDEPLVKPEEKTE